MTEIFASNVLGHVALMEGLIAPGQLTQVAVYVGSEAARGFPQRTARWKTPVLPASSTIRTAAATGVCIYTDIH